MRNPSTVRFKCPSLFATLAAAGTRASNASKGTANAAGNRGSYAKCTYTMSNATLGTGGCVFSNGATFDLHVSQ